MDQKIKKVKFLLFEEFKQEHRIKQDLEQLKRDLLIGGKYRTKISFDLSIETIGRKESELCIDSVDGTKYFSCGFEYYTESVKGYDDADYQILEPGDTVLTEYVCTYEENGIEQWSTSDPELMEDLFYFLIDNQKEINDKNK